MNRSMETHALLDKHGFNVQSFGVGGHVKLPGPSAQEPNVYTFGTPYADILDDLCRKDEDLYTRNRLLQMLRRNAAVKKAPQRWQDCREQFDVAVTFEERILEQLLEDMQKRGHSSMRPLLVINIDVKDNHEEAAKVAPQTLRLCQMLEAHEEWEEEVDDIVAQFEAEYGRRPVYSICFY
ncbi:hypothetical protein WJX81_003860 [Elliptochloris bilobata]|uniref:RNA polymerase II subunit A C-terminal domain phosphatase SSU72 n=1 Tax=Elliptochloris bilobata TaxID=381761 RepID=A0AAW1SGJ0_9CHLO